MGIEAQFSRDDIEKRFKAFLDKVEALQIEALQELGEMCVTHARELSPDIGFHDHTGNLRSSIGYIVFNDGEAIHMMYDQVKKGSDGIKAGEALAKEIGAENPKGILLVVTAGMNYAAALEANGAWKLKSKRSYIVLSSALDLAEELLPKMLEELISNIKNTAE